MKMYGLLEGMEELVGKTRLLLNFGTRRRLLH
jgi:hypothetical protein